MSHRSFFAALAICALVPLTLAGTATAGPHPFSLRPAFEFPQAGKIQHVVIIVQENRSFDNLFQGYPGADTVAVGKGSDGSQIPLAPVLLEAGYSVDHSSKAFFTAFDNGRMDGFNLENSPGGVNSQYAYVPRTESQPYFNIASQYVLGDRMFTSQLDDSFVSHQYLIAGQANHAVDLPNSYWGCDGGPDDTVETLLSNRTYGPEQPTCQNYQTLGDELSAAKLSWRYYAEPLNGNSGSIWSAYQAIRHIRETKQWTVHVKSPGAQFLTDIANGYLANVTWITPTEQDSDHPASRSNGGPSWVTSLVNAVGESPFWDSTAVFVMWDDWGGWYDHVPPPQLDFDGLGIRVPLMVISPYAKRGYVSHVRYEQGSLLRFVEDTFGLGRLAASDTRANDPADDCFNFVRAPRAFTPFTAPHGPTYFMQERHTGQPPDDD